MEITSPVWSALSAVAALLAVAGAVGFVVVAGPANPAVVAMLAACGVFFGASALPRVRAHRAYGLLNAGYVASLFGLWYLVVRSSPGIGATVVDAIGAFAVLALGGLAVELYSYRRGAGRQQPE